MGTGEGMKQTRTDYLNAALQRLILLRETGPKSTSWQRARKEAIWRLHALLEAQQHEERNKERADEKT